MTIIQEHLRLTLKDCIGQTWLKTLHRESQKELLILHKIGALLGI